MPTLYRGLRSRKRRGSGSNSLLIPGSMLLCWYALTRVPVCPRCSSDHVQASRHLVRNVRIRMRVFNLKHVRVEFMYAARSTVRTFCLQYRADTRLYNMYVDGLCGYDIQLYIGYQYPIYIVQTHVPTRHTYSNCITCMLMVLMNNNFFGVTFVKKRSTERVTSA